MGRFWFPKHWQENWPMYSTGTNSTDMSPVKIAMNFLHLSYANRL